MFADPRRIAVAFCAIGAFLHLYAPQAVLPMMAREYGVGAADASLIITAGTLAVAATAPFAGALSDVIGRKRLIVVAMALLLIPATMTALAPTLNQIIFWRFVHGLLLPPIFAVTIAYVGGEFPPAGRHGSYLAEIYARDRLPLGKARTFSSSSVNAVLRSGAACSFRRNSQRRSSSASKDAIRCVPTVGSSAPALASRLRRSCNSSVTCAIFSKRVGSFTGRTPRTIRRNGEGRRVFFIVF